MSPRIKNLLYFLAYAVVAAGVTYFIVNQISLYSQEQDLQVSDSTVAKHDQIPGFKTYQSQVLGVEFSYPEKLKLTEKNGVVNLNHQVAFENYGCNMMGDSKKYPTLDDFNMNIEEYNGNVAQAVKKNSPYMPAENFTKDSLKVSPGFIDQYQIGNLKGFAIYEGVEGCGHTIYYFPISSTKTLVVTHDMVQQLSGIMSSNVKEELLKVPGVIDTPEAKTIFEGIMKSVKIKTVND